MIVVNNTNSHEGSFESLLNKTEDSLNQDSNTNNSLYLNCNGTKMESVVEQRMKDLCPQFCLDPSCVTLISGHNFPDILVKYLNDPRYFGVEVKTTKEDKWTSTGSSIVESLRPDDVDRVYMFFGKLAQPKAEFLVKHYEDCLSDIAVTHSPRYIIDMKLPNSGDIFSKMSSVLGSSISYDKFRNDPNNIDVARRYYRCLVEKEESKNNKKELPWWLRNLDSHGQNLSINANIRPSQEDFSLFSEQNQNVKKDLVARGLILFYKEILNSDYTNFVKWLCRTYFVIVHNARDLFSAGGKVNISVGSNIYQNLPGIIGKFHDYRFLVKYILENNPPSYFIEDIFKQWEGSRSVSYSFYDEWVLRVAQYCKYSSLYCNIPIKQILYDL